MAYFTRGVMKLGQFIHSPATGKATQTTRYLSNINRNIFGSTIKNNNAHVTKYTNLSRNISNLYLSRSFHSEGDKDLVKFLNEEISFEKENLKEVPTLKNFNMSMDGTVVTLRRDYKGEKIEVVFNCNDSINIDGKEESSGEYNDGNMEEELSDLVSYPTFTVTISKPSGKTLLFNCNCHTGINEDDMDDGDEDGQYEILRFDSVQVYNSGSSDRVKIYEAETENMDGDLYDMLMHTLLEREINGTFVNNLIDLSTSVEHRHYLTFLKSLRDFSSGH